MSLEGTVVREGFVPRHLVAIPWGLANDQARVLPGWSPSGVALKTGHRLCIAVLAWQPGWLGLVTTHGGHPTHSGSTPGLHCCTVSVGRAVLLRNAFPLER